MRTIARWGVVFLLGAMPLAAMAQQDYKATSVSRVVRIRILPGKQQEFYKALHMAVKIWEAEKAAGLIQGYTLFHSVDYVGTDKYDVGYRFDFKNMAALDMFADQAEPIIAKTYGSPEKSAEFARMRAESAEVVSSQLIRTIELLPEK